MKNRIIAATIIGIIIFAGAGYLYDQMYDCLSPPMWFKIPRQSSLGDCLQMYADGTLPDYTIAREDYAKNQAQKEELIKLFQDTPEVIAFYAKYDDAIASARDDHISYFAGSEDDAHVRMNMFFDENYELDYIDFHCYFQREHQFEFAQEDIVNNLEKYECKKYGT